MQKDSLLELLSSQAHKWMNVNQAKEIVGTPKIGTPQTQKIDFYPRQISYNHKEIIEIELVAENGGLLTPLDTSTRKDYRLRVQARVGDLSNDKNHGVGIYVNEGDIAFENTKAIIERIKNATDTALKVALQNYFEAHALVSELAEDKFGKLSEEESVEYIEKEKSLEFDMGSLGKILEEASDYLSSMGKVESSEAKATIQKINRRFVNFERGLNGEIAKSHIFTSDIYAFIQFGVEVRDKNKNIMEYTQNIVSRDINEFLSNGEIKSAYKLLGEEVKKRFDCEVQESGLYPAIFNGPATGVLFHEGLVAHLLSAKYIGEEHATTFKNKIGKYIIPKFISVYNDPTIKDGKTKGWGAYLFDEEGVRSQRAELVKNGVLTDLLHDRSTAGRANRKSNGCCRASETKEDDSAMELVTEPRVGILEIKTSNSQPLEKMIKKLTRICKRKGLEYGLFIEGGGGDVLINTGEFRIYPQRISRIYTDGKIVPVSSAYIIGNPYNMLNEIVDLSEEIGVGNGSCGAESGFVTTSEISPYALISKIEVRQEEGDIQKDDLQPDKD